MVPPSFWKAQCLLMGRKKTYQRDDVLLIAMNTFWDKGYHGTSLADLIETTRLNKKTLYAEFGSKHELFHEALQLYTSMGAQQAVTYLDRQPWGLSNIKDYFRSMTYAPNCRGCLMTMTINQKNLVTPASVELVRGTLELIENLFLKNLNAAYEAGAIQSQEACQRIATFLIFSIQGITTMGKLEGEQKKLDNVIETIIFVLDNL